MRRGIAACSAACLVVGWSGCALADTLSDSPPNIYQPPPVYQLPKSPDAIDDMMQKPGGKVDDVPPPPSDGGAIDDVPPSQNGNGDYGNGDYGDDTNSKQSQKPKVRPRVNIDVQQLIDKLTNPPPVERSALPPDLAFAQSAAKFDETTRRVALSFCVVNNGKGPSAETNAVILDAATRSVAGRTQVGALSPGNQVCIDDIWTSVPAGFAGSRRYDLTVDPENTVKESNEQNNADVATVEILALPDLSIASAAAKLGAGTGRIALSVCVTNGGKGASGKTEVSIRDGVTGGIVASAPIGPLPAGNRVCSRNLSTAAPADLAGARQYDVTVDPNNRVTESNEDNNTGSATVAIGTPPDLVLATAAARFDEAAQRVMLSFCVANRGKGASGKSDVLIRDRATGDAVAAPAIESLPPGSQTCRKGLPAPVPAGYNGTRQYDLTADSRGVIKESDENNNTSVATAEISALPDLEFANAAAKFDEAGRRMALSFCVINQGHAPAPETRVSIRDPAAGSEVANAAIGPLGPGDHVCRKDLPVPVPAGYTGTQRYDLTVDPDRRIGESDEGNNTDLAAAQVSAQPNLGFADASAKFDEAARRAALSFCVVNSGQAAAGASAVSIRDATAGGVLGTLDVAALPAGQQACLEYVAAPMAEEFSGDRPYELTVDASNAVAESNEGDNVRTVSVLVPHVPSMAEKVRDALSDPKILRIVLVAVVGLVVLAAALVFLLFIRPRRAKTAEPEAARELIQFRGRPDPGTYATHSAAAEIVLPRLQLRGHVDPGRQEVEIRAVAAE